MVASIAHAADEEDRLVAVRGLGAIGNFETEELDNLVHLARRLFQAPYAAVNIIDEDRQNPISQSGITLGDCSRNDSVCTQVVRKQDVLVIPDLSPDTTFATLPRKFGLPNFRFYAGAPLELEHGVVVGAFCVLDTKPRSFSEQEVEDLRHFGVVASGLLRLHRSNIIMGLAEKELRKAAMTDPLTGFYNREALEALVDPGLASSLAAGSSFGALYLDMDGFKAINDTKGHDAGDEVLRQASDRIRNVLRRGDIVVRMGGDEFAVFCPQLRNRSDLQHLAERLLEEFRIPFLVGEHCLPAKVSIGAAQAPESARDRVELIKAVDAALYEAKAKGKDCFSFAGCDEAPARIIDATPSQ